MPNIISPISPDEAVRLPLGSTFHSPNLGADVHVVQRSGVTGAVRQGDGTRAAGVCREMFATADGRHVDSTDGVHWQAPGAPAVYFECYRADGSGFHGFVDEASRQIVQVG